MRVDIKKEASHIELVLGGDLSIVNITALKGQIEDLVNEGKNVQIMFSNVEAIDIAFLQLLASYFLTFQKENLNLGIYGDVPQIFIDRCEQSGFGKSSFPLFNYNV